jgi:hypothetical protein
MKKVYISILIVVSAIIVFIVFFIQYLYLSGQIKFLPDKFAEEFWKFLANLLSIIFGFVLINVYWAQKERRDKLNQAKRVLLSYLCRINHTASKIDDLLSISYSETELDASRARDQEITSLTKKLEKLANGLESLSFDPSILSDSLLQKIFVEIVWEGLFSDIESLASQYNFRKSFETFSILISSVRHYSSEGIELLTESKKMEA